MIGNKLSPKPHFQKTKIFGENVIAMHMKTTRLYFDKPVYLEFCIFDISKTLIYDFHYNYTKNEYGDSAK